MANDPVTAALDSAKSTLEKANKFTESVEGNPTSAFAPKKPESLKLPHVNKPPYSLAFQARSLVGGLGNAAQGVKNKQQNVQQYTDASKQ